MMSKEKKGVDKATIEGCYEKVDQVLYELNEGFDPTESDVMSYLDKAQEALEEVKLVLEGVDKATIEGCYEKVDQVLYELNEGFDPTESDVMSYLDKAQEALEEVKIVLELAYEKR